MKTYTQCSIEICRCGLYGKRIGRKIHAMNEQREHSNIAKVALWMQERAWLSLDSLRSFAIESGISEATFRAILRVLAYRGFVRWHRSQGIAQIALNLRGYEYCRNIG